MKTCLNESEVLEVLAKLYPRELEDSLITFSSLRDFIKNLDEYTIVSEKFFSGTYTELLTKIIKKFLKNKKINLNADLGKLEERLQKRTSQDTLQSILDEIYVSDFLSRAKEFENNLVCIITFLVFFKKHTKVDNKTFSTIIFTKVSRYTLDSDVLQLYRSIESKLNVPSDSINHNLNV